MSPIEVHNAFPREAGLSTRVWISERAAGELVTYSEREQPPGRFRKKLLRYARNGFAHYFGNGIEREWGGVLRIGDGGLFRLIGFFDDETGDFIVTDAFLKKGQSLTAPQRDRIDGAAEIKRAGSWRRAT